MREVTAFRLLALSGLLTVFACSASSSDNLFGGKGQGGSGADKDASNTGGGTSTGGTTGFGGGMILDAPINSETKVVGGCEFNDDTDHDGDGYTGKDGDCNDCDPNTNPGAFDDGSNSVDGGPPVDVNCDGVPGGDVYECDDGLGIDDSVASNAAKAIGLCRTADPNATGATKTWGVLDAKFVKADGTDGMNPVSHGLLPQFGQNANVQQGKVMLALSSGTARGPAMPDYKSPSGENMKTECDKPIPNMESPSCDGITTGDTKDPAALEVRIRVPTNAKSFKFFLNFYTYEFPIYICTEYNDFFVTLMTPVPAGSPDGNISKDLDGNPISVNNSLLQVCKAQKAGTSQKYFPCPLGTALLDGSGFEGHAATGWLQTIAPVEPGSEITLRWAIWDSGDHEWDSTVLVDNFTFSVEPAVGGATTKPVDGPK